jgi:membrane-associated phospholipid phosphatase
MPLPLRSPWTWLPPLTAVLALVIIAWSGSNRVLFLWLNHRGHALGTLPWMHFSMFGDGAIALALVFPLIRRAPRLFWAAVVAAIFAGLWTQLPKQWIDLPRPLSVFPGDVFYQAGPAYRHVSFPSGHAAAAFALAGIGIMGAALRPAHRLCLLAAASLVGLSRIMLGVHWPIDVLWGMLGGWLGAAIGLALLARRDLPAWVGARALAGLVLAAVAAGLLASRHVGMPAIMPAQRLVAVASLLWGGAEWLRVVAAAWMPFARPASRLSMRLRAGLRQRERRRRRTLAHPPNGPPATVNAGRRVWLPLPSRPSWSGWLSWLSWLGALARRKQKRGGDG